MRFTLADSVKVQDDRGADDSGAGDTSGASCPHGQPAGHEAFKPLTDQLQRFATL